MILIYQGCSTIVECGTVANEKCKGDQFNMFLILRPNDEYGCSMNGFKNLIGLHGIVNVNGKCQSSCKMQYAYHFDYSSPLTNNGELTTGEETAGEVGKWIQNFVLKKIFLCL